MNDKNLYKRFCDDNPDIPIFLQYFWLNAACGKRWDFVYYQKQNEVVAVFPYYFYIQFGLKILKMPPLTQFLGPWMAITSNKKYYNELSEQKKIYNNLIGKLPKFGFFNQNFSPIVANWLPFYWKGYQQTTRYTYAIENLSKQNEIWKGFRENIRWEIRKAEKIVSIRDDLGLDNFLKLNAMVFQRKRQSLPYSHKLVERLDMACTVRNCRKIFFAEDSKGQIHAAVYIVWDRNSAYYLMGGGDPELRNSGATSLCLWEAIKFAATKVKVFDFEGSMIISIEKFFRAFGAKQKPYFQVTKNNSAWLTTINYGKDLIRLKRKND